MQNIGFGCTHFTFAVYIENPPIMSEYNNLIGIQPLQSGEINLINQACGNGWRKVFNVYAKLLFALNTQFFEFTNVAPTWQQYRDTLLLQQGSKTALLFSPPKLMTAATDNIIHIVCGRTYAKKMLNNKVLMAELKWLNEEFAIDINNKVIVCPYFDYRQLSNQKIEQLSEMITSLVK